jgi:predicted RNA-binding protein with PUA-like domain
VTLVRKTNLLSLKELREFKALQNMRVLQKGNRLSITPVTEDQWTFIEKHLK